MRKSFQCYQYTLINFLRKFKNNVFSLLYQTKPIFRIIHRSAMFVFCKKKRKDFLCWLGEMYAFKMLIGLFINVKHFIKRHYSKKLFSRLQSTNLFCTGARHIFTPIRFFLSMQPIDIPALDICFWCKGV